MLTTYCTRDDTDRILRRPRRSVKEVWFHTMLGIDVAAPPLPTQETRGAFMRRYAEDSGKRLAALRVKDEPWWEEHVAFFDMQRSWAWCS